MEVNIMSIRGKFCLFTLSLILFVSVSALGQEMSGGRNVAEMKITTIPPLPTCARGSVQSCDPTKGASIIFAKIPAGSRRDSRDSFAEKGIPWKRLLIAFLVVYGGIGWLNGSFDRVLPAPIKSSVLKRLWATPFEPVPRDAKP